MMQPLQSIDPLLSLDTYARTPHLWLARRFRIFGSLCSLFRFFSFFLSIAYAPGATHHLVFTLAFCPVIDFINNYSFFAFSLWFFRFRLLSTLNWIHWKYVSLTSMFTLSLPPPSPLCVISNVNYEREIKWNVNNCIKMIYLVGVNTKFVSEWMRLLRFTRNSLVACALPSVHQLPPHTTRFCADSAMRQSQARCTHSQRTRFDHIFLFVAEIYSVFWRFAEVYCVCFVNLSDCCAAFVFDRQLCWKFLRISLHHQSHAYTANTSDRVNMIRTQNLTEHTAPEQCTSSTVCTRGDATPANVIRFIYY